MIMCMYLEICIKIISVSGFLGLVHQCTSRHFVVCVLLLCIPLLYSFSVSFILISLQRSVYWSLSLHATLLFDKWWWRWQQRWFVFCRTAEEAFVKDRDTTQPGGEWEKICRICEFNPKNSKNTKDVSRLRSILLQLKQTPLVRWTATFPAQIRCRVLWLWNV